MGRNVRLLCVAIALLLVFFILLLVWALYSQEIFVTALVIISLVAAIVFFLGFFVLKEEVVLFKGHNTRLYSRDKDEDLIRTARELHPRYLKSAGG